MKLRIPEDGDYSSWEVSLALRCPLTLSEMRWPSAPLGTLEARAAARWGIECHAGWRQLIERLMDRLEAAIAAQPADKRDAFRIVQIKEKFGRLTVYLAGDGTSEMNRAIQEAAEESIRTCEVCGAPGLLAERRAWWAARCALHESWTPHARLL